MPPVLDPKRYLRAFIVAGMSVLVFLICVAFAYPHDNVRLAASLHEAHQSQKYKDAVAQLAKKPGLASVNECTSCHEDRGPISTLVFERIPVGDAACGRCHAPDEAIGRPFLSKEKGKARLGRPAHQGLAADGKGGEAGVPGKVVGLQTSLDGHLSLKLGCGECHPDHKGKGFVEKIDVPTAENGAVDGDADLAEKNLKLGKHAAVSAPCMACHLPEERSDDARQVIAAMLKAHDGIGFEPEIETKTRSGFIETLQKQQIPARKQCGPYCHGEHAPQLNDD